MHLDIPSDAWEVALVMAISMYGSVANTFSSKNPPQKHNAIKHMLKDAVVAGFTGYIAYAIAKINHLGFYETHLLGGLSGYMGGRFLEEIVSRKFGRRSKTDDDRQDDDSGDV